MDYEVPDVPGFAELWGGSVFHCPFCHGWEVRDQRVAVYAPAPIAARLSTLLKGWTDQVTVVDPDEVERAQLSNGALPRSHPAGRLRGPM